MGIVSAGVNCAEPEYYSVYIQLDIPFIVQNVYGLLPTTRMTTSTTAATSSGTIIFPASLILASVFLVHVQEKSITAFIAAKIYIILK